MAINLLEFSNQKPVDGSINILMSSSNLISGEFRDYVVMAVSIPFESDNAIEVEGALNQLNDLTIFMSSSGQLTQSPSRLDFSSLNLTRKTGYYFIQFERLEAQDNNGLLLSSSTYTKGDPYFNNLITGSGNRVDKTVYMEPFVEGRIDLSEYEATENNATQPLTSHFRFSVDRDRSQLQPNNLEQITASLENATSRSLEAEVQESNYSSTGWINGRYNGSKLFPIGTSYNQIGNTTTTPIFFEDPPSLSFISFKGSRHDFFADDSTIRNINPNEREIENFYFNFKDDETERIFYSSSNSGSVYHILNNNSSSTEVNFFTEYSKYPTSGSHIYDWNEGIKRYIRVPNSKFYILETGGVATTNEKGALISGSLV